MIKQIGTSIFHGGDINHQKLAESFTKHGIEYNLFTMDDYGFLVLDFDEKDDAKVNELIASNDNTIDTPRTKEELMQAEIDRQAVALEELIIMMMGGE